MNIDKLLGNLYEKFDEVSKENALKLKQILDLEEILYNTRKTEFDDVCGACWCMGSVQSHKHQDYCQAARKATEHLWRKSDEQKG